MKRFPDRCIRANAEWRTGREAFACFIAAVGAAFVSTLGHAQTLSAELPRAEPANPVPAWRFTPDISVTESYTDNAALLPSSTKSWVTESTPGFRIEQTGVRSRFFLDYRFHHFHYTGDSQLDNNQRLLGSFATVEAIDNWLFVDAGASITQQNRSAFSIAGATDTSGLNRTKIETATNQISPHIRGTLANTAAYQLRFVGADIRSNDPVLPDTKGAQWAGFIKNQLAVANVGWSLDGDALSFRNKIVGKSQDARIRGTLSYEYSSQIHVSAIGGREVTNFAGTTNDGTSTSGIGLVWSPDTRTQFAAVSERRFFGNGHSVSFSHRAAMSTWRFTSTRDATALSAQLTSAGPGSSARLLSDLLIYAIPDPVAREAAVRQRLEQSGVPANSALSGGFATARPFLIRNDDASVALAGVNNTVTLSFSRRDQRGFGPIGGDSDSFTLSNNIRQQGVNLNWIHRLSPLSTLSFVATALRSEGLSATGLDTRQRSFNLLFSTRVGINTFATFGARRAQFDNELNTGFRENAVLGSVSVRY